MNTDDGSEEEEEDRLIGGSVTRSHSSPVLLRVLTILSCLGGFLFGYDTGVVSGAMLLVSQHFSLTPAWHSAIVSVTVLTAALASFSSSLLLARLGRRPTVLFASAAFLAGSLGLGAANSKFMLLASRAIVGVGVGLASAAVPLYIGECSTAEERGFLVTCNNVAITGGQLVAGLVCGALSSVDQGWRWMLGLAALPAALQLLGFVWLPESPRFLVRCGKLEAAGRVLSSLRPRHHRVAEELEDIVVANRAESGGSSGIGSVLSQPSARKALLVGCLLQAVQQFAGINTVMYFSASILQRAGAGPTLAIWLASITAAVNFVFTLVGLKLVTIWKRRTLLLTSLLLVSLALAATSISFITIESLGPVPVLLSLCLYLISFAPGLGPLPWTINAELHPVWSRSTSVSLATATNWISNFAVSASFLGLANNLGEPLTFLAFSLVTLVGTIVLYIHLPETKDVPLEQVERLFTGRQGSGNFFYSRVPMSE